MDERGNQGQMPMGEAIHAIDMTGLHSVPNGDDVRAEAVGGVKVGGDCFFDQGV